MSKLLYVFGAIVLCLAMASLSLAQTTTTTVTTTPTQTTQTTAVQNADGSWTVVEYPVGREVQVNLTPVGTITGLNGTATVLRADNGSTIKLNLTGVPADVTNLNLYAVDPSGAVTLLGPVTVSNGTATYTTTTPLTKFMIFASPQSDITAYSATVPMIFRSGVPQGLSVIPQARTGEGPGAATGERVAATAAPSYSVPMLGIPSFPKKKETTMHLNPVDTFHLRRATVFITPNFNNQGKTRVKAKFHELTDVQAGAFLTLWAVGPNGEFMNLGSTTNTGHPNVATIDTDRNNTNVPFQDFGLFMTVEPTGTATKPSGPIVVRINQ